MADHLGEIEFTYYFAHDEYGVRVDNLDDYERVANAISDALGESFIVEQSLEETRHIWHAEYRGVFSRFDTYNYNIRLNVQVGGTEILHVSVMDEVNVV